MTPVTELEIASGTCVKRQSFCNAKVEVPARQS
jgi:hypothetical protein